MTSRRVCWVQNRRFSEALGVGCYFWRMMGCVAPPDIAEDTPPRRYVVARGVGSGGGAAVGASRAAGLPYGRPVGKMRVPMRWSQMGDCDSAEVDVYSRGNEDWQRGRARAAPLIAPQGSPEISALGLCRARVGSPIRRCERPLAGCRLEASRDKRRDGARLRTPAGRRALSARRPPRKTYPHWRQGDAAWPGGRSLAAAAPAALARTGGATQPHARLMPGEPLLLCDSMGRRRLLAQALVPGKGCYIARTLVRTRTGALRGHEPRRWETVWQEVQGTGGTGRRRFQ